jgi:hypothetical protein
MLRLTGCVAIGIGLTTTLAAQDDEEEQQYFDREPEKCISTNRIAHTEIVDDRTIVFRMRGRDNYMVNMLPRRCPGLERNKQFLHETRMGRLCETDFITVLERSGFGPGFTCRLGYFHPATAEDVAFITSEDNPETRRAQESVEVTTIEVPPDAAEQLPLDPEEADGDP